MEVRTEKRRTCYGATVLFVLSLLCFLLTAYGGVRSPDGENIFWVAESLAVHHSFEVKSQMPTWEDFMLVRGVDGKLYSSFAPAQSLLLAPLVWLGLALDQTGWYESFSLPVSFMEPDALKAFIFGMPVDDLRPHALRFIASLFNPIVSALLVVVFFFLMRRMTGSVATAFSIGVLLALATPLWSYSGAMFKEPLTMTCVLLSFFFLVANDFRFTEKPPALRRIFLSGLFAGLALTAHITAIFFLPFLFIYAFYSYWSGCDADFYGIGVSKRRDGRWEKGLIKYRALRGGAGATVFFLGFSVFAGLLAWYNYYRFGAVFETGRFANAALSVRYGSWVTPWEGIIGFMVSPGKGLFWFAPAVIAGLFCWPGFHRRYRALSVLIAVMVVFRVVMISCRSDWHGGFCLGPRHLLPVIPFLLIPFGCRLSRMIRGDEAAGQWRVTGLLVFVWVCVSQQIYFCLGEPISYYYYLKHFYLRQGVSIFIDNKVYFDWNMSPLLYLLEGKRGPFLLQAVPWNNYALWLSGVALAGTLLAVSGGYLMWRHNRRVSQSPGEAK